MPRSCVFHGDPTYGDEVYRGVWAPAFKRRVQNGSVWYASHATGMRAGSRGVEIRISNWTPTTQLDVPLSSTAMERTE
jgi:hypothetical protein